MISFLKQHKKPIYVQLLFVFLTIMFSMVYVVMDRNLPGDLMFHLFRIRDVAINLTNGHWPSFSFSSEALLGNANMTFYPWLPVLPIAWLVKYMLPLHWVLLLIGISIIIGLEVSYLSVRTLNKSIAYSFTFALIYMMSSITLSWAYGQEDIGSLYGLIAFPLAFAGWYHWINTGKWKMMSAGVIFTMFVHLPSAVVLSICLFLTTCFFYKQITKSKVLNLVKAICVTIICSAMVWIPILVLSNTNKIWFPSQGYYKTFRQTQMPLIFAGTRYFLPTTQNNWGIMDLLAVIFIIINWKRVKLVDKKFFAISCIILFCNINYINTFLMKNTILRNLQFMHRFCVFSHLLLSFIMVDIIFTIFVKEWSHTDIKKLIVGLVIALTLYMSFGELSVVHSTNRIHVAQNLSSLFRFTKEALTTNKHSHPHNKHSRMKLAQYSRRWSVKDTSFATTIAPHVLMNNYADYYPQSATIKQYVDKKKIASLMFPGQPSFIPHYNKYNGFQKREKHTKFYKMPVVTYHQQKYNVLDNGKKALHYSNNHFMYVKMHKGNNDLHFYTPMMWYRYLAIFCSFIGFLCFIPYKKHHYSR